MAHGKGDGGNRFADWSNRPKVSGMILLLAAVFFLAGALYSMYEELTLRASGVEVPATVLEVHGGKPSYVVLEFTTREGRHIVAEVSEYMWRPKPKVGDSARILYSPEDPVNIVRDVRLRNNFVTPMMLGGLTAICGCLIVPAWTGRIRFGSSRSS